MEIVKFENVSKIYETGDHVLKALDEVDLTLEKGQFIVILGPSGAGKSTLLNLLGGLDVPTKGKIIVDGTDISKLNSNQLAEYRAMKVGFIFQFYNLIPTLTVLENVSLVNEISKDHLDAKTMLDEVGLLDHINNFPSELSGGEQQRVGIARAIVNGPPLLIADEPTGNLDPKNSMEIMQILDQINQRGITVIVSTHDNAMVDYFRKRVITLDKGEIVRDIQAGTYE